jgi:protein-S-isoprenylcysteine O-methyltransferase Ste14
MTPPDQPAENSAKTPQVATIKIGTLTITGGSALAVLVLVFIGVVALVVYSRPSLSNWPMWVSGALWIFFIAYWSAVATKAAPAVAAESDKSRRTHELILNSGLLLLFVPLPSLGFRFLPATKFNVPAGLALQTASLLLALWARRHLGRNWSARITTAQNHQLIRSGPYRTIRHPIYTAMFGMAIGTAIVSSKLHALVGLVLVAIAYARKIPMEEKRLNQTFGPAYAAYRRDTGALIPWLF